VKSSHKTGPLPCRDYYPPLPAPSHRRPETVSGSDSGYWLPEKNRGHRQEIRGFSNPNSGYQVQGFGGIRYKSSGFQLPDRRKSLVDAGELEDHPPRYQSLIVTRNGGECALQVYASVAPEQSILGPSKVVASGPKTA
jgi:hypothetical protein